MARKPCGQQRSDPPGGLVAEHVSRLRDVARCIGRLGADRERSACESVGAAKAREKRAPADRPAARSRDTAALAVPSAER